MFLCALIRQAPHTESRNSGTPRKTTPKSQLQCFLLLIQHNFLSFLKGEIQKSTGEFVKTDGEVAKNLRGDMG